MKIRLPTKIKDLQEIVLTITTTNLKLAIFREHSLKKMGVIAPDWELNQDSSSVSPEEIKLLFKNGTTITATSQQLIIRSKINHQKAIAPTIAHKLITQISDTNYQGLKINFRRLLSLPGNSDIARKYITETLLAPGAWQQLGKMPLQASLEFIYQLENRQLHLNIYQAEIQQANAQVIAALFFSGTFNYNFSNTNKSDLTHQMIATVNNWEKELEVFTEMINQKFLG